MLVVRGIMSGEMVSEDPAERNVDNAKNETGMGYVIEHGIQEVIFNTAMSKGCDVC